MLVWELKKIAKSKTSLIALILMMMSLLLVSFIKPFDMENKNEYFDEVRDKWVTDTRSGNEIAQDKLDIKVNEIKSIANKNVYGIKDNNERELAKINQQKLEKDKGEKYKDIIFYQVFEDRITSPFLMILIVAIIVSISSNIYIDEKISNVDSIILSSKNKNKVLNSKFLITLFTPVLVYSLYIAISFLATYIQYGSPINGNLEAYRIYSMPMLIRDMTIVQYILSEVGVITLVLICISIFSGLFSFISQNTVQSISSSILFIVIGKLLTLIRFLPNKLSLIIQQSNFIDLLSKNSLISSAYFGKINILSLNIDISLLCIGVIGLIAIIGIILNFYVFKKVLNR